MMTNTFFKVNCPLPFGSKMLENLNCEKNIKRITFGKRSINRETDSLNCPVILLTEPLLSNSLPKRCFEYTTSNAWKFSVA